MSEATFSGGASNQLSPSALGADSPSHRISEDPETKLDKVWTWISDHLNPIVVKEIRQSLKSRQFTISFGLTILAAVGWTIIAVSLMVPRLYYLPGGRALLLGFFFILAVPLLVIIPFSAFRSLTSESEDGTYELLSISALSSTQIIYGKMASASVQILLYLSALAPCIMLTYLLRGLGLGTIAFVLGITVAISLLETALSLALASVSVSRLVQNGVTVLFLIALLVIGIFWLTVASSVLAQSAIDDQLLLFAMGFLSGLTLVGMLIALLLRAAAAAIDFPSSDSSTPVRQRLFFFVALCMFWLAFGVVAWRDLTGLAAATLPITILLAFSGALVTGERGVISPRTQRQLPKTFIGRTFFTFLYPGAGLGYVFHVALFSAWCTMVMGMELYYESEFACELRDFAVSSLAVVCFCYIAIYLGVNRLMMMVVPKDLQARQGVALILLLVTILMTHLVPIVAAYLMNDYRDPMYGPYHSFNTYWTVMQILEGNAVLTDMPWVAGILVFAAFIVLSLNLALVTRDVMLVRVTRPPRVEEEDTVEQPEPVIVDPLA